MKVAFLDRDGVINKEVNYLHKIRDFRYPDKCLDGMVLLRNLGFNFIIVTNQAGIAKGHYTVSDYNKLTRWYIGDLKRKGISILDVFFCPHHVDGINPLYTKDCVCRKPKGGMLEAAISMYDIDIKNSIMVGDKLSDIEAAKSANISQSYLVKTGHEVPKGVEAYNTLLDVAYNQRLKFNV